MAGSIGADVERAVQSCYSTWGTTYFDDYYGSAAPYPPVHVPLITDLVLGAAGPRVLDAGCGPASILRTLFGRGLELYGFDLTAEMVAEAKRVFAAEGLPAERIWTGSVLDPLAYAALDGTSAFDAVLCTGVMPHIPADQDDSVIGRLVAAVRPGGTVVIEARNQLFGLFTLNRPSYELFRSELIRADELTTKAPDDVKPRLEAALDDLAVRFRMDLPPIRKGKAGEPGYDEVLSRAHNPFVLRAACERAGLRDIRLKFYHFHALPPMLDAHVSEFALAQSIAMEDPDDWRGYFMASAFLITGVRA